MKAIINNINQHGDKWYSCSDCGNNEIFEEHKYCSQCGKKIDGFIHTFVEAEEIKNDRT